MELKTKLYLIGLLALSYALSNAQEEPKKVEFSAQTMEFDQDLGNGARRLLDDVVFTHEGAKMYCDSAYLYSEINSLDAFNNVFINQGDTLFVYSDILHYDGNSKLAKLRGNVKMVNRETTLFTESLDYDIGQGIGSYLDYAKIVSNENTIESIQGFYYTQNKMLHFRDSVTITNPDYLIKSDTMKYQTESKVSYFFGPTRILSDSSTIYCEKGWYNTDTDISELRENAFVDNLKQTVFADFLYYEKHTGKGQARKNVLIVDKEQDVLLKGHQAWYNEKEDFALLTDSAQFIQITAEDSIYLHADTLKSFPDSNLKKQIFAYPGVSIFKSNLQARCDSMVYSFADSIGRLYTNPVLWSEQNQLSADYIEMITKNRKIDKMHLYGSSFIASQVRSDLFNQIKGKNMICYFKQNELHLIDVMGNGQTVYYPVDDNEVIGANKAVCSNLSIYLVDGEVNQIIFHQNPNSTLHPLEDAPKLDLILKGFQWREDERPKDKLDIFRDR